MEMQNNKGFNEQWEDAFSDAEMDVPNAVWDKISISLADDADRRNKKKLLFFQLLAAASVAFALSVGGIGVYQLYFNVNDQNNSDVALKENKIDQEGFIAGKENSSTSNNPKSSPAHSESASGVIPENEKERKKTGSNQTSPVDDIKSDAFSFTKDRGAHFNKDNLITAAEGDERNDLSAMRVGDESTSGLPEFVNRLFELPGIEAPEMMEMKMVPWYSYIPEKKTSKGGLWAGIGFSTGSYNPNVSTVNNSMAYTTSGRMSTLSFDADSKRSASFTKESPGQTYNIGANVGTRLSQKWVLQTGIAYIQQQSVSTSNVVSTQDGKANKAISSFNDMSAGEKLLFTAPYDIHNSYELISVPLQAGYIIVDKKLQIVVLTGVSNNILLQNEISAASGDFEDAEVAGTESKYRSYQVNGLLGTEFSYHLTPNYTLSLVPQLRQAVNSVTRPGTDYSSVPTTLEIGFRFKYTFRK